MLKIIVYGITQKKWQANCELQFLNIADLKLTKLQGFKQDLLLCFVITQIKYQMNWIRQALE